MFDKDIVMLQVTMYISLHFFQVFSECLCVYFYLHQNLFTEKKVYFFVEGLKFYYFICIIVE